MKTKHWWKLILLVSICVWGHLRTSQADEFIWDGSDNPWPTAHWYVNGSVTPSTGSYTIRSSDTYTISSGEVSVGGDMTTNGQLLVNGGKITVSANLLWNIGHGNQTNASSFIVDGGTVVSKGKLIVGRGDSSNNLFHLKNGTVEFSNIGITSGGTKDESNGEIRVDGGSLKAGSINVSQSAIGNMNITDGVVECTNFYVAMGGNNDHAKGTLSLSGGTIQSSDFYLAGSNDSSSTGTPDSGTFLLSGGKVVVKNNFFMAMATRTSQLVVTGGTFETAGFWNSGKGTNDVTFLGTDFTVSVGDYISMDPQSNSTVHFMFADGGISTVTAVGAIAWRKNIDLGIASGITLLENSQNVLLKSTSGVIRNIAEEGSIDSSLWTLSGNGTKEYLASLDLDQKKGELGAENGFLDLSQNPSSQGFVELVDTPSDESWPLAVYFSEDSSSEVGLDELILWMNDADKNLRTYYNAEVGLTEDGGILLSGLKRSDGSLLAWDFSDFNQFYDVNFQVTGIGLPQIIDLPQVPEPATVWLSAGLILGFLAYGKFRRG